MEENKKQRGRPKKVDVLNEEDLKVSNKLTEKEKIARKLQKYASLGNFSNRVASLSTMYGDVALSSAGNFYSPQLSTDFLEKPQNLRERRAWYRHFYNSNEFVGQAIDLHSTLPLSKIRLEKPEGKNQEQIDYVYNFFVEMCNELKLFKILLEISHEYHLFGNCVPGNADIKTIKGLKKASDITKEDFILTNKGRYRKVLKISKRDCNKLISIKCEGSYQKLITTEEHPIEILRDNNILFVKASEVKETDYVLLSYPIEEKIPEKKENDFEITKDISYLIGFWLGNGILCLDPCKFGFIINAHYKKGINKIKNILYKIFEKKDIKIKKDKDIYYIELINNDAFIKWWGREFGTTEFNGKKFPIWFVNLPKDILLSFLYGVIDSNKTEINNNTINISFSSKDIIENIRDIALKCGFIGKYDYIENQTYKILNNNIKISFYSLLFSDKNFCLSLTKDTLKTFSSDVIFENEKFWKEINGRIAFKVEKIETKDVGEFLVYNFEVEEDHTYCVNGFSTHNCFIYAEDHNPYEGDNENLINELKEKGKIEAERLYKEFGVIDKDPNYKGWRKLIILPPDQVRIKKIPLSDDSIIEYIPDPETRKNILGMQQSSILFNSVEEEKAFSKIPRDLTQSLQSSGSIPLDTDPYSGSYVYHLARKKSQYETLGVSVLERCINTLLLQDKLRQVQTQIASRHMTPIRIVWGDRISDIDVESLREQVDLALVDPDYSIITNYEVHWEEMGSNGRLLELSSEYEHIENSLFAGLGVTRELLTGEGTYAGNRITLEILNTQYLLFRALLQEYVEDYLFKPVAKKKGFVEKDKYGREKLLYPRLSFTRLAIKDNDSFFDQAMQLYQKGSISIDVILDTLNIDPISTKKKIESDLFTINDFAFNQLMSNVYANAAQVLVEKFSVAEKLADYLKLDPVVQQGTPQQEGVEGLESMGRFASRVSKENLNKVMEMLLKNPKMIEKLLKYFENNNNNNQEENK
jgi:hypothetical protein